MLNVEGNSFQHKLIFHNLYDEICSIQYNINKHNSKRYFKIIISRGE